MRVSLSFLFFSLLSVQSASCRSTPILEAKRATNISDLLKTYPIPAGVNKAASFGIKIRTPGQEWRGIDSYRPQVVQTNIFTGGTTKKDSSMVYFDFTGGVEVSATYRNGPVRAARVRPDSFGIATTICGSEVRFNLTDPRNVVLQINDDIFDVLHVFTNPIEENPPTANTTDVLYFGPGLHTLTQPLNISSGQTVYVAGGAVINVPAINFNSVEKASLRGRGVLSMGVRTDISIIRSSDVVLDGIIGFNVLPRSYESRDVTISNFRAFSTVPWGDGINVYCSQNVLVDGAFLRTSDDCFTIYNHRDDWSGDSTNITLQNSALWADVAHPINIGTHGNTENPEATDGVLMRNLDILDHHEKQIDYQGCIAINAGDSNTIKNVVIDDVRVEDFRLGQLFNFRVMYNEKYNTSPGHGIKNITIKNLAYQGSNASTSIVTGYDGTRTVEGLNFYNLTVNGLVITDNMRKPGWYRTADYVPMFIGPHVKNVTFNP